MPQELRGLHELIVKRPFGFMFLMLLAAVVANAQAWRSLVPAGGGVNSFATDSSRFVPSVNSGLILLRLAREYLSHFGTETNPILASP
jgi:hypothetical protein